MEILSDKPIGLFDSGLGGLTVLRELQKTLPERSYIYFGDNARTPYGTKSVETIIRYSRECAEFLMSQNIGLLVVACNTASSAALMHLEKELPIPVIGTIGPAVRAALAATRSGRIGVLGTNATCASGIYQRELKHARSDLVVVSNPCPLFVPLVESGMVSGEIVDKLVEFYLTPLRDSNVDTVILGCTHYPLLFDSIQTFMGADTKIVECSTAIADDVKKLLHLTPVSESSRKESYFVTDEVGRFNYLATAFLGGREITAARIESLCEYDRLPSFVASKSIEGK